MDSKKFIFVGQAPSRGSSPLYPLARTSGVKLAKLAGLPFEEYLTIKRINVNFQFRENFDMVEAVKRATWIEQLGYTHYILLGSLVTRAFGLPWDKLVIYESGSKSFLILPHPSGLNLYYNSPENTKLASDRLQSFLLS